MLLVAAADDVVVVGLCWSTVHLGRAVLGCSSRTAVAAYPLKRADPTKYHSVTNKL